MELLHFMFLVSLYVFISQTCSAPYNSALEKDEFMRAPKKVLYKLQIFNGAVQWWRLWISPTPHPLTRSIHVNDDTNE
jgi:hypothetical protein